MADLDSSFKALADSTRREIIYLLAVTPGGIGINAISKHFQSTRQGITKHIMILENAGLVQIKREGRERKCYLNPLPLQPILDWLDFYKSYWNEKLNELDSD